MLVTAWDLVRWQVSFSTSSLTKVTGTRLVVAEYVIGMDFLVLGTTTGDAEVGIESELDRLNLDETSTTSSVMGNPSGFPERSRYIVFRVQTRTRNAIPRRLAAPSSYTSSSEETLYFPLKNGKVAEVRTIQGKVPLPNLQILSF